MKDSKALLLKYLGSIGDPNRAAALFAEDGALELPFLRSLGVGARYAGRREIATCLHQSDTPRKAGGLMGWTASKAVGYWFRRRAEARLY